MKQAACGAKRWLWKMQVRREGAKKMALFKRGKTWWTDFSVNGMRFRLSLETTDWREAQSLERQKITQANAGKLAPSNQQFARLAFSEALDRYLADRSVRVTPGSKRSESDHAKPVRAFFGLTQVSRISSDDIISYIWQRSEKKISNTTINMEIGILRRVLTRARIWNFVANDVPRLPERRDIGRAMSYEQKAHLLRVAGETGVGDSETGRASNPEHDDARLRAERTALGWRWFHRANDYRPAG
jgi:hypothetical protein